MPNKDYDAPTPYGTAEPAVKPQKCTHGLPEEVCGVCHQRKFKPEPIVHRKKPIITQNQMPKVDPPTPRSRPTFTPNPIPKRSA
ncbi:MAG: hypothetical protein ACLPHP_22285 [Candidatus Sulfotelmatobacter sp.]